METTIETKIKKIKLLSCDDCNLRITNTKISGVGNIQSKLFIVVDNPSEEDIAVNTLFSSGASINFKQLLYECGFDISSYYVTSIIKCYPGKIRGITNRPSSLQMKCCAHIINKELETANPKIILVLGDTPLKFFLGPKYNIKKYEGIPIKYNNFIIVGTYSPKELMADPSRSIHIKQTLLKIKFWLNNNPFEQFKDPGFNLCMYNINDVYTNLDKLQNYNLWACDIETDGLGLNCNLFSISFSSKDFTFGIPIRKPDGTLYWTEEQTKIILDKIKNLASNSAIKIFHNVAFDALILKKYGIEFNNFSDTRLIYYLLDENLGSYKLKNLAWKLLGIGGYEEAFIRDSEDHSAKGVATDILLKYNCSDAYVTYLLYQHLYPQLTASLLKLYNKIILPMQHILINASYIGLKLDCNKINNLIVEYEKKLLYLENQIFKNIGIKFNLNSTHELNNILFNVLKIPKTLLKKSEKTGLISVDEASLLKIQDKHAIIPLILQYRKLTKFINTYFKAFLELKDENDVLHTTFFMCGTRTGRLSSKNPNCQILPRGEEGKDVKDCFIAREGHFLLEIDFSQIEFRLWGFYAQDDKMKRDIERGLDIHKLIASKVFNKPIEEITKEERSLAKNCVFGLMYGRGLNSIAEQYKISIKEAENITKTFFSLYPKSAQWLKQPVFFAKQKGYLCNIFGRMRRLFGIYSKDNSIRSLAERQAVNFLPQSTAADYTFFRAILLEPILKQYNAYLILTVHDSLIYECPIKYKKEIVSIVKEHLSKQLKQIFIKIDFNLSIGKSLGSLIEIKSLEDIDNIIL